MTFPEYFALSDSCILPFEVSFTLFSLTLADTSIIIEQNSRIFLREGDSWGLKGRFSKAILLQEPLLWETDEYSDSRFISITAVSLYILLSLLNHSDWN
jgi:hypothetical protein